MHTVSFRGEEFAYTLRSYPRAKHVRITIHADGSIAVSKPKRVSVRDAEAFVQQQAAWVRERVMRSRQSGRVSRTIPPYTAVKEEARAFITQRVEHFAARYGATYAAITIRDQKTRWGSCSARGTLSFSYKLLFLPPELADYVVVHEICHRAQMNHSPKFWALVAKEIPDYPERRKELRAQNLLA